jgi:hypothetical protein
LNVLREKAEKEKEIKIRTKIIEGGHFSAGQKVSLPLLFRKK